MSTHAAFSCIVGLECGLEALGQTWCFNNFQLGNAHCMLWRAGVYMQG